MSLPHTHHSLLPASTGEQSPLRVARRTKVINGELPGTFRKWYPTFAAANEPCAAAA
jgi:hypothetical protein